MTELEKARFITELIANVEQEILGNISRMPEDWDGHEMRQYIADRFNQVAFVKMTGSRLQAYNDTVMNLP